MKILEEGDIGDKKERGMDEKYQRGIQSRYSLQCPNRKDAKDPFEKIHAFLVNRFIQTIFP